MKREIEVNNLRRADLDIDGNIYANTVEGPKLLYRSKLLHRKDSTRSPTDLIVSGPLHEVFKKLLEFFSVYDLEPAVGEKLVPDTSKKLLERTRPLMDSVDLNAASDEIKKCIFIGDSLSTEVLNDLKRLLVLEESHAISVAETRALTIYLSKSSSKGAG